MIWFQQVFGDHTPTEQTHLYCKYRINILQTGNSLGHWSNVCPYALLLESNSRGLSATCGLLLCLPLPSYPVYSAMMNFEYGLKKIEERNAANHNPSRPDRWPCRYQSHLCFLVAQGQSGLALLWNVSNHKQFNYQINWATWLNQLCARVCRPGYLTHIHSKVRLTGVPELDMVTIHCHGSQFRNKYIFKKETFLFLSAQWAAVSTLT